MGFKENSVASVNSFVIAQPRQPEMIDTGMSHIRIRCIARK